MNVPNLTFYEFETQRKIIPLRPTWADYEQGKKEIYAQDISAEEKEYQVRCLADALGL